MRVFGRLSEFFCQITTHSFPKLSSVKMCPRPYINTVVKDNDRNWVINEQLIFFWCQVSRKCSSFSRRVCWLRPFAHVSRSSLFVGQKSWKVSKGTGSRSKQFSSALIGWNNRNWIQSQELTRWLVEKRGTGYMGKCAESAHASTKTWAFSGNLASGKN